MGLKKEKSLILITFLYNPTPFVTQWIITTLDLTSATI
jgi:hypothetical protein